MQVPMQSQIPIHQPPSAAIPPSVASSSAEDENNQAQMLLKVINLTDEQINLLPPEDRAKVVELRNQLRTRVAATNQGS